MRIVFSKKNILIGGLCIVASGIMIDLIVFPLIFRFLRSVPKIEHAEILVVQGWVFDTMVDQTVAEINRGNYRAIVVSGNGSMTERTKKRLLARGVDSSMVFTAPYSKKTKRDHTFNEALYVKKLLETQFPDLFSINIATGYPHSKKSVTIFRRVLGKKYTVGIVACKPNHYDSDHIWKSPHGMYNTFRFFIGYLYALVWPLEWIKG
ncbi:MAG: DUF218 domain-containing protein [Fibrobacter sp.]|nr:DUF218 domain-containing protein [Fibrobacter sp.]